MTTEISPADQGADLSGFRAAEAVISGLEISSAPDESKVINVIKYDNGQFTLGFRAGAPGVVVPLILRILQDEELCRLLAALRDELAHPGPEHGPDRDALIAFVAVLAAHVERS
jgi:hypothetical protein